ncbi:hypothetical protein ACFRFL_37935 [Streptomyces sp. NPDC056708]|uniref:hypothetical protein n=1 Tax=unclassified Streptomyces TaxID=2593676 RepID=UPI0036B33265
MATASDNWTPIAAVALLSPIFSMIGEHVSEADEIFADLAVFVVPSLRDRYSFLGGDPDIDQGRPGAPVTEAASEREE